MTASNRNKANGNDTLEMKNQNHEWLGSLEPSASVRVRKVLASIALHSEY